MSLELNRTVAVVLAGGFGTRVAHLLPGVPKPMASVAGKPFLEWVVRFLATQGIRKVILSTGHLADVVEAHFRRRPVPAVNIRCVAEDRPLGTGGGFLNAVRHAGEAPDTWLVLNGDSLVFADLAQASSELKHPEAAGVVIGCAVADASRYGTLAIGPSGDLRGFSEKRPGKGVINAGIYLLRSSLLRLFPNRLPLSLEQHVFPQLLTQGAVLKVCAVDAPFLDIGTPESLRQAESFVGRNRARFSD
ncbi:MAG TPA: sugar phosphate nucleotidyltransferase [Candidatus Paceibacterota bacterium]|nr:sugar phosphate nucleotidyltransferase [Verrucomicrobiota bacterium]HSA10008.1 sugar phosphate nucleotidyltransferase [Candidatus Paceibacterota bacterium]